ncbi:polymer-forming cytoskeletal protein [Pantoea sp. BAV 3049]|uniref:bactofilin family protein n=1 Tax=Pantoea sp. BAV 3049 TaxID=2654188 RepID=UPI00131DB2D0|nr:polymer-forming cytoskeletal protein [Pantoea sp. BAV 3049]
MNYNLLWIVWLVWAAALIVWGLGWEASRALIRQYPGLLPGLSLAIIAGALLRNLLFDKDMTMFKRKENIITPTETPLAPQRSSEPDEGSLRPDSDFHDDFSVADFTTASDTTTIPETCVIDGEIRAVGDIHINGAVNGKINSEKTVFVQKSGRVEGEIFANRIEISGELKGLCRSREVAINANGFLDGTIECESLSVNQNGRFYGLSKPWQQQPEQEQPPAIVKQKVVEPVMPLNQDFHLREQTLMQ